MFLFKRNFWVGRKQKFSFEKQIFLIIILLFFKITFNFDFYKKIMKSQGPLTDKVYVFICPMSN